MKPRGWFSCGLSASCRTRHSRTFRSPHPGSAMAHSLSLAVPPEHAEKTLAALLRALLPGQSWADVRRLIENRRAKINGELCLDPARRVHEGEVVEILPRPAAKPQQPEQVVIRHLDEHVVVVEKPSGINTVRHPAERAWTQRRKSLSPALEDIVPRLIQKHEGRFQKGPPPRL